jgi:penicillin-binding protein 1C
VGAAAARQVGAILAEVPAPAGFDGRAAPVAFKTGTSYRFRDGWAVGWSGTTVIGVWLGRADGATCAICNGPGGAAPLLFRLFDLLPPAPLPTSGPADRTAPPALVRIDRPAEAREDSGLAIAFPPDGATVEAGPRPLVLEASGGTRPFRWLVDGRPLPVAGWRRSQPWAPDGDGFVRLTVVDAIGRTASSEVRVSRR